mmetsp:Transcript_19882/g.54833  ORF Transcript_19882/g.54833 Transcript_19882/m.54833 type:complete len:330 (-) Transcript_19882:18-1007(-)
MRAFCLVLITGVLFPRSTCSQDDGTSGKDTCYSTDDDSVKIHTIGSVTPSKVMVVDNLLGEITAKAWKEISRREDWVPVMSDHRAGFTYANVSDWFRPPQDIVNNELAGFPGLRTDLSIDYEKALLDKLKSLQLQDVFDLPQLKYSWSSDSFFGNTCYHPKFLSLRQRMPHIDVGLVKKSKYATDLVQLAVVHYLSQTYVGSSSGTAFYQDKMSKGSRFRPADCAKLEQLAAKNHPINSKPYKQKKSCYCERPIASCHDDAEFTNSIPEGYLSSEQENEVVEVLLNVPYQYDRAVIYQSKQLHTANIADVNSLSCNATAGRLTGNIFIA